MISKKKILVVDDEEHIRSFLSDLLESEGYLVITSPDTDTGYKKAIKSQPDLMILDLKMPQIGGVELCRLLRENLQTKNIPIIMLTVQSSETDKVIGLEIGADDYITKPFGAKELLARIHSLLRRVSRKDEVEILSSGGLELNLIARTVTLNKKQLELRPKEFDLLHMFLKKPNVVLSREYMLESVFDVKEFIATRTIDTHIKNLRKALGPWGKKIKTVFGRGFKFVPNP
ncbi:MAG: response regulator transcription factor [Elusimicrobia bacterium]|nr:response regulator transcription factor [Candidatus Liberimonas magnetica]